MGAGQAKVKVPDYGNTAQEDAAIWQRVADAVDNAGHSVADILSSFPVYIRRINAARFLAHYELFRMVKDVPGHIVECGVFRGASLLSFAKFLEIFNGGDRARKVYGFDNFAGFEHIHEKDGTLDRSADKRQGGWDAGAYYEELKEHVDIFHADSYVPRSTRIVLIKGDLSKTAPEFMTNNPGCRISLLHLDVDVYEPTLAALKAFYPAVVQGGLEVFDQWALTNWPGESKAAEEYFGGKIPKMQKFPWLSLPGGFFVKE
jgi:hypothetical protein